MFHGRHQQSHAALIAVDTTLAGRNRRCILIAPLCPTVNTAPAQAKCATVHFSLLPLWAFCLQLFRRLAIIPALSFM